MALAIPAGYARELEAGRPQAVQVIADGSDANSATVALGYATNLIAAYAQERVQGPAFSGCKVRESSRESASGSIRASRAATS